MIAFVSFVLPVLFDTVNNQSSEYPQSNRIVARILFVLFVTFVLFVLSVLFVPFVILVQTLNTTLRGKEFRRLASCSDTIQPVTR